MQVRANVTLLKFRGLSEREYLAITVEASLNIDQQGYWEWSHHAVHPNEWDLTWADLTDRERAAATRNLTEAFMCMDDKAVAAGYGQAARKARRRNDLKAPRPWWVQPQSDGSFCVLAPSRFRGGAPILVAGYLCEEDARQIAWASTVEQVRPDSDNAAPTAEEARS